ncbi:EAL domain-containing protein [Vibrio vulnificus]|uniref:EAL domain-containing protein n=1 Tax=Vibrio vulnificus TaxID=672 RepID=UPI0019D4338D|nr:EAL domain-containing protein [Vibrio vulnificus]MBN8102196.1 EAL domain-containing protein [Vibrio vulnificus]
MLRRTRGDPSSGDSAARLETYEWHWKHGESCLQVSEELFRHFWRVGLSDDVSALFWSSFTTIDKLQLLNLLDRACQAKKSGSYRCWISLNSVSHYVLFRFVPQAENAVAGEIRKLFSVDSKGNEFSTLFRQAFDNDHHGILLTDAATQILLCNRYFENHTGYKLNQIVGQCASILDSGKHSDEFYQSISEEVNSKGLWQGVVLIRTFGGAIVPQELTLQKLTCDDKVYYLGLYVDFSDRLYRLADMEHGGVELLTQLPTEKQFTQQLTVRWMDSNNDDLLMVLAFLPNFAAGDEYELKQRLSESLEKNRVSSTVGYLGGNHFVAAIECNKSQGPNQVQIIHQTIRKFFAQLTHLSGEEVQNAVLRGKVGVSILGHDTQNPKVMVSHAVQAMLNHEGAYKGMITFYHGSIHREVLRRRELEELVVRSIREESVEVFYQPIVDTVTWDIAKFEALCRFKDKHGQWQNTQEMVGIAEDLEMVADLDWTVGKKSLEGLKAIHQRFGQRIGITINRSLNTKLGAEEVLQNAEQMVCMYADTPELVTIELTESAYFDSESNQSELIKRIRHLGVSVAIDDFGTGYSSFTYLSDCNFDLLKIDREFVTNIRIGTHKYHIVRMITELSHTLNVKVVAEGVETKQELEVLCGLGVDYIQGYFFSKPLPLDQLHLAWNYQSQLSDFLESNESVRNRGVLRLSLATQSTLGPQDSIGQAKALLDAGTLTVIPIVDDDECLGIVDSETLNLYLSATLGTKLETMKDLTLSKRTLNQVMKTQFSSISYQTKAVDIGELIVQELPLPWIVLDELGKYMGVVTQKEVLRYFAQGC